MEIIEPHYIIVVVTFKWIINLQWIIIPFIFQFGEEEGGTNGKDRRWYKNFVKINELGGWKHI